MRKKVEFFIPKFCQECRLKCKKEFPLSMKPGFDAGKNAIYCRRKEKIKEAR